MPAPRLCPHCGTPTTGRCQPCRTQRYGHQHQTDRNTWTEAVATGTLTCARADIEPELGPHTLDPGTAWHLDHLPDGTTRPSCATHNVSATGR
jgi:hypothetical protein